MKIDIFSLGPIAEMYLWTKKKILHVNQPIEIK